MLITNIQLQTRGKKVTLSAEMIFHKSTPTEVYFTTDKKYKSYITADGSPFLAAALLPCMKRGESIHVDGTISEQLYRNTQKIMNLVLGWNLGLKRITITATKIKKDASKPKYAGTFFSGGVDSFYTYLKHRRSISHFILIHGFDIELKNTILFKKVLKNVEAIAKEAKTKVIAVETNITSVIESKLIWDYSHGGALAAVAMMFRRSLKDVYISSAVRKDQLFPYGTHPDLDPLWSTENQAIHHDGTEYTRFEKVLKRISKSPLALKHLRVCNQNIKGSYNCSKCFKCLVTMIQLESAGVLEKVPTFSHALDLDKVRAMRYDYKLKYNLLVEVCLDKLQKDKREIPLQEAIIESLRESKKTSLKQRIVRTVAYVDQNYNDRRLYQWIFKLNGVNDRNAIFKFLVKQGVIK